MLCNKKESIKGSTVDDFFDLIRLNLFDSSTIFIYNIYIFLHSELLFSYVLFWVLADFLNQINGTQSENCVSYEYAE